MKITKITIRDWNIKRVPSSINKERKNPNILWMIYFKYKKKVYCLHLHTMKKYKSKIFFKVIRDKKCKCTLEYKNLNTSFKQRINYILTKYFSSTKI